MLGYYGYGELGVSVLDFATAVRLSDHPLWRWIYFVTELGTWLMLGNYGYGELGLRGVV